jgi:thiol-disulfide isomerase/thioredoxin
MKAWLFTFLLIYSLNTHASGMDVSEYKGKVVYLDFWASWCRPCAQSFPWMNTIAHHYKDSGLVVLSVNVDVEKSAADAFLKKRPADFKVIYDPEGILAEQQGLIGMPSSYLYNRDGVLISTHVGFNSKTSSEAEKAIRSALGEPLPRPLPSSRSNK